MHKAIADWNRKYKEKSARILAESTVIHALQDCVEKLQDQIQQHEAAIEQIRDEYPAWYDAMVEPIAEELCEKLGFDRHAWYMTGPCGINNRIFVTLGDSADDTIKADRPYHIVFVPESTLESEDSERWGLCYEAGETEEICPKGSVGALSGMNNVVKVVPDDLDELVAFLKGGVQP